MKHTGWWSVTALAALAALAAPSCARSSDAVAEKDEPAVVEPLEGTSLNRLILTAKAVERIGIKTETVGNLPVPDGLGPSKTVPYAALIYDTKGETLVYRQAEPLVFVREPVTVDRIAGATAFLFEGPPPDTAVVTVGGSELFGIEFGIGK